MYLIVFIFSGIRKINDAYKDSISMELQQRSCEYTTLDKNEHDEIRYMLYLYLEYLSTFIVEISIILYIFTLSSAGVLF